MRKRLPDQCREMDCGQKRPNHAGNRKLYQQAPSPARPGHATEAGGGFSMFQMSALFLGADNGSLLFTDLCTFRDLSLCFYVNEYN